MSLRFKLTLAFFAVLALTASIAGFFWYQSKTAKGLNLEIGSPAKVVVGVPFTVTANIANQSKSIFKDIKLSLSLAEGIVFLNQPEGKVIETRDIASLGVGSLIKEEFELIALADESALKQLEMKVSYLPTSVSSRFEKTESIDIPIRGSGIDLSLESPAKVFSGEEFEISIHYKNVSEIDFENLKLNLIYPPNFNFVKSSTFPDVSNNIWNLGNLRQGSEMTLKIWGNAIGPADSFFDIQAKMTAEFLGKSYPVGGKSNKTSIERPPLALEISGPDFAANLNDELNYRLRYANNSNTDLRDVIIRAWLTGEMFDFGSLSINDGFLRASDNAIIWNAANMPRLSIIPAGSQGEANFKIRVKNGYPIRRLNDKNFTLKVKAEIESSTIPSAVAAQKTISVANFETKVAGKAAIDAKAFFRDAKSGILNQGSLPLKVGKPTNFTIHWQITNFSNDVKNAEIKSFLGPNVRFTGVAKSNAASAPIYNERTQEMSWLIDRVPATTGIAVASIEAIFQVEAVPSSSDLGETMVLMGETQLRAADDFTELEITASDSELTTELSDDPTVKPADGTVQP